MKQWASNSGKDPISEQRITGKLSNIFFWHMHGSVYPYTQVHALNTHTTNTNTHAHTCIHKWTNTHYTNTCTHTGHTYIIRCGDMKIIGDFDKSCFVIMNAKAQLKWVKKNPSGTYMHWMLLQSLKTWRYLCNYNSRTVSVRKTS